MWKVFSTAGKEGVSYVPHLAQRYLVLPQESQPLLYCGAVLTFSRRLLSVSAMAVHVAASISPYLLFFKGKTRILVVLNRNLKHVLNDPRAFSKWSLFLCISCSQSCMDVDLPLSSFLPSPVYFSVSQDARLSRNASFSVQNCLYT